MFLRLFAGLSFGGSSSFESNTHSCKTLCFIIKNIITRTENPLIRRFVNRVHIIFITQFHIRVELEAVLFSRLKLE